jgi:hypothetical protein
MKPSVFFSRLLSQTHFSKAGGEIATAVRSIDQTSRLTCKGELR